MTTLLEGRDLGAIRGETILFKGLGVHVDEGEVVRLAGPNGSGKTTLLKMLAGLREPDFGEVLWNDKPTTRQRSEWHDAMLFIGHKTGISPELTAPENLALWGGLRDSDAASRVDAAMAELDIARLASIPVAALSAGQKQRVALCRLVLCPAQLWLLDEPLTALDAAGQEWLEERLLQHAETGGAAIVSTHQSFAENNPRVRLFSLGDNARVVDDGDDYLDDHPADRPSDSH